MFHRESGYYKTTYAKDMALYPLPVARWTVVAIVALLCAAPFALHEYYGGVVRNGALVLVASIFLGSRILMALTGGTPLLMVLLG